MIQEPKRLQNLEDIPPLCQKTTTLSNLLAAWEVGKWTDKGTWGKVDINKIAAVDNRGVCICQANLNVMAQQTTEVEGVGEFILLFLTFRG